MQRRGSPGGGPGGGGAAKSVPPPAQPRGEDYLPAQGGREGGAGAARALCALNAPRSLSAAEGRHIAPPWPCRRGGERDGGVHGGDYGISAAQAEAGGWAVGARERGWAGVPGEAAPGMRGEAPPPAPGEKAAAAWLPSSVLVADLRPAPDPALPLEAARNVSGIRNLPETQGSAALAPQGSPA